MIILGFDTCLDKMYVAISKDGEILASEVIENTDTHYHSAFLISTVRNILKSQNLTPNDINAITTNVGPGSFTGIRACNTVARVFAQATEIKTIGISSLEILSKLAKKSEVLVALDARKNMAYTAIYKNNEEVLKPQALPLEKVQELINDNNFEIITDNNLKPVLENAVSYQEINEDLGRILLQLANEKQNELINWSELKPLYIQPPPVTIKK